MAPDLPHRIVGIRPGEKVHEIMCPADDSHLTLEFHDHYVIRPTIVFTDRKNDFTMNRLEERGTPVDQGFEYNSGSNERFLGVEEIISFNQSAEEC
jgi:UDP-N-acetylglucosamine 4,6-dehydratase